MADPLDGIIKPMRVKSLAQSMLDIPATPAQCWGKRPSGCSGKIVAICFAELNIDGRDTAVSTITAAVRALLFEMICGERYKYIWNATESTNFTTRGLILTAFK